MRTWSLTLKWGSKRINPLLPVRRVQVFRRLKVAVGKEPAGALLGLQKKSQRYGASLHAPGEENGTWTVQGVGLVVPRAFGGRESRGGGRIPRTVPVLLLLYWVLAHSFWGEFPCGSFEGGTKPERRFGTRQKPFRMKWSREGSPWKCVQALCLVHWHLRMKARGGGTKRSTQMVFPSSQQVSSTTHNYNTYSKLSTGGPR